MVTPEDRRTAALRRTPHRAASLGFGGDDDDDEAMDAEEEDDQEQEQGARVDGAVGCVGEEEEDAGEERANERSLRGSSKFMSKLFDADDGASTASSTRGVSPVGPEEEGGGAGATVSQGRRRSRRRNKGRPALHISTVDEQFGDDEADEDVGEVGGRPAGQGRPVSTRGAAWSGITPGSISESVFWASPDARAPAPGGNLQRKRARPEGGPLSEHQREVLNLTRSKIPASLRRQRSLSILMDAASAIDGSPI